MLVRGPSRVEAIDYLRIVKVIEERRSVAYREAMDQQVVPVEDLGAKR
jgi:hypothetical protein